MEILCRIFTANLHIRQCHLNSRSYSLEVVSETNLIFHKTTLNHFLKRKNHFRVFITYSTSTEHSFLYRIGLKKNYGRNFIDIAHARSTHRWISVHENLKPIIIEKSILWSIIGRFILWPPIIVTNSNLNADILETYYAALQNTLRIYLRITNFTAYNAYFKASLKLSCVL